ncbi:MAG: restriction endonuclease [Thermodesulfobacteriota bacterium]
MNEWSQRTLQLVNEHNYLDRLHEIYAHEEGKRKINRRTIASIQEAFKARNNIVLLNKLLDLDKFPYKDSYVAFLRKDREAIERNPQTANRICSRLYEMGIDGIIAGITQPKEANTRRGQQFTLWARNRFRWVNVEQFRRSTSGIIMLDANERDAMRFCNNEMGVGIAKRPDMVAKSGNKYVIGEAKFLSSTGGNQGRAFEDGITLATNSQGSAFKVFILDGVHWIYTSSNEFRRIEHGTAPIFSVLLLEEFLAQVPQ